MRRTRVRPATVVHEIVCDRCGRQARRDENDFALMTSIALRAGFASIFGDGNRVEIDLCEPCLHDTLGTWLRVGEPAREPDDTSSATLLGKFDPERHGGEFPALGLHGLAGIHVIAGLADRVGAVAERASAAILDALTTVSASIERIAAMESRGHAAPDRRRVVASLLTGNFDDRPVEVHARWRLQFDGFGGAAGEFSGCFMDERKGETFPLVLDPSTAVPRLRGGFGDLVAFVVAEFCRAWFGSTSPPAAGSVDVLWTLAELSIVESADLMFSTELARVVLRPDRRGMRIGWQKSGSPARTLWRPSLDWDDDPVVALLQECLACSRDFERLDHDIHGMKRGLV